MFGKHGIGGCEVRRLQLEGLHMLLGGLPQGAGCGLMRED